MSIFRKPSDRSYALSRGEAGVQLDGFDDAVHMGDFESLVLKPEFEEIERFSKNFSTKTLARSDVIARGGTLDMTVLQRTPEIKQIAFMGLEKALGQVAENGIEKAVAKVRANGIIMLGKRDVTVHSVKVGAIALPATAYKVDRRTGLVQVFDEAEDVTVTYSVPVVDRTKIGGFSTTGLFGKFWFRGLDAVNEEPLFLNVWRVQFKISGDTPLVGGDDYDQLQITGKLYPDLEQVDPDDQLFTVEGIPAGAPADIALIP